jgi:hypothetical protein
MHQSSENVTSGIADIFCYMRHVLSVSRSKASGLGRKPVIKGAIFCPLLVSSTEEYRRKAHE